jgi:FixJ family two-component response regulator
MKYPAQPLSSHSPFTRHEVSDPATQQTIYVVDDDASFLRSVTRLLKASGFDVASFDSAQAFLAALAPQARGCVIADLRMPGMDGIKLQEKLKHGANPLPIIFLTGEGDIPTSVTAMKHGAEDFLTKRASGADIIAAIKRALDRDAQESVGRHRTASVRELFSRLSEREHQILRQVIAGKLNKQIAGHFGLNERTVKLHRTNITRKLGVQSVAEITRLAAEAEIMPEES